jgi:hypothetical protein
LRGKAAIARRVGRTMLCIVRPTDRQCFHGDAHRELVIMLATENFRRERGALPTSEEDLSGRRSL